MSSLTNKNIEIVEEKFQNAEEVPQSTYTCMQRATRSFLLRGD